jgi:hypothetical protein
MTRDRITTLLILAIIAAAVLYVAFHTYWDDTTVTTPLQGEAAHNPYYSVERLSHAVGIRTQRVASLRVLPSTSNVLFVSDLHVDVAHTNLESLEHWVEGGGRLVVTGPVIRANPVLQSWSGIAPANHDAKPAAVAVPPSVPPRSTPTPVPVPLSRPTRQGLARSVPDCPVLAEKDRGEATGTALHVCIQPTQQEGFQSKHVPLWALTNENGQHLLRVVLGRGSLTVIGSPFLLAARTFLREDDAQAFIDSVPLKRGDQLMILSDSRAEPFVVLLWRLGAPAIILFAVAMLLLIWRHLPRFGPLAPVPIAARRSLAEQIRANARFAWRTGKLGSLRAAARQALDRDAEKRIASYASLDPQQRAAELGKRAGVDPAVLNSAMTQDPAAAAPVQRAAIALLEQTRRTLNLSPREKGTA